MPPLCWADDLSRGGGHQTWRDRTRVVRRPGGHAVPSRLALASGDIGRSDPDSIGRQGSAMLMALILTWLSIPLWIASALLGVAILRRRRIAHESGAFACAVRGHPRSKGDAKWRWQGGYGRWASDVFIFQKALAVHHGYVTPIAAVDVLGIRPAVSGEVGNIGTTPVVAKLLDASGQIFEVAACVEDR